MNRKEKIEQIKESNYDAVWEESKHPRAKDGKFSSGNGVNGSKSNDSFMDYLEKTNDPWDSKPFGTVKKKSGKEDWSKYPKWLQNDEDNDDRKAEKGAANRGYDNVKEVDGDLLKSDADIIAHQTNCIGVMGAGVAAQIRPRLSGNGYQRYKKICDEMGSGLFGRVQVLKMDDGKTVANVFGEDVPGSGVYRDTNYNAVRAGMLALASYAKSNNLSVAIPAKFGCGLAGGDWNVVRDIIYDVFGGTGVKTTIVRRKK